MLKLSAVQAQDIQEESINFCYERLSYFKRGVTADASLMRRLHLIHPLINHVVYLFANFRVTV